METVNFEWHLLKINSDGADESPADQASPQRLSLPLLGNSAFCSAINTSREQRHLNFHRRAPSNSRFSLRGLHYDAKRRYAKNVIKLTITRTQ